MAHCVSWFRWMYKCEFVYSEALNSPWLPTRYHTLCASSVPIPPTPIHRDSTIQSFQPSYTCHTYYSNQVRMNHPDEHVHHVYVLSLKPEKTYNPSPHLIHAGLLSIQTTQHALNQLSLALFWFPGLLINWHHHVKLCTFPLFQMQALMEFWMRL